MSEKIINVLDRLYIIDDSLDKESISSDVRRVLRFFYIPMSPGYLIRNLPEDRFLSKILEEILTKGLIKPFEVYRLQFFIDKDAWEFYRSLNETTGAKDVQLNITNRCVNRCQMCRKYEWPQIEIPLEIISKLAKDLRDMNIRLVILSGGEPLLHRDIMNILDILDEFNILILTSGVVPLSKEILKKIKRIQFSVDALNPEIYKKIRGPGNVEILKRNILFAKEEGVHVTITTVIQKDNVLHVPEIIEFCEKEGLQFMPSAVHTYGALAFYDLLGRSLPLRCVIPFYHCLIDPMGDIFVCCHHHEDNADYKNIDRSFIMGNIFRDTFSESWFSEKAVKIKRYLYENRATFCKGCFRYLLENAVASHVRMTDKPFSEPYIFTYTFPLSQKLS